MLATGIEGGEPPIDCPFKKCDYIRCMQRSLGLALASILAVALPFAGCAPDGAAADAGPEILELTQGRFTGGDFPLQFEWRDEPRVLDLRRQERLDDVIKGAHGQLETFKRLTAWTRAQFEPGFPDPYPLCNGVSILSDIRSGKTGGFCGQYSYILGDALKSFGYFAIRYVELESESGAGHFAVEAWCDDLSRWVLLDPLNAALYIRDGAPLSSVEIHDSLIAGRTDDIHVNRLPIPRSPSSAHEAESRSKRNGTSSDSRARNEGSQETGGDPSRSSAADKELLSVFYNVAVSTRNDFARLNQPLSLAQRESLFLRYGDPRVAPFRHMTFALSSTRRDDFLMPMDQVAIETRPEPGQATLHVSFSTRGTCPHFARYRVRIADGPWKDSGPLIAWNLASGENRLEVRTVNAYEILGPVFRIRARA